jgi:ABC-2 type transport system permease protein
MRLWAEDKRSGTFELLMTLPMKSSGSCSANTSRRWPSTWWRCSARCRSRSCWRLGNPDTGAVFGGYLGALLLGGLYMAVGIFTSGLLRDQISPSSWACWPASRCSWWASAVSATIDGWVGGLGSFLQNAFGLMPHYQALQRGVLEPEATSPTSWA